MLEAVGVRGVAGDRDVDSLVVHDGDALADVVGAVAADLRAVALGEGDLPHDLELAGGVVEAVSHIGEAVDARDDVGRVLAEAVRMTRRGSLRARLALLAMPIAPSAAAKDSCPARKQKHFVSSGSSMAARLPCPRPTLRSSATEPGMQKVWRPSPRDFATATALDSPFLMAIAAPSV